jgi:hypothetical protein
MGMTYELCENVHAQRVYWNENQRGYELPEILEISDNSSLEGLEERIIDTDLI